jgi:hypothetical protein
MKIGGSYMTKQANPEYMVAKEACSKSPEDCDNCPYNNTEHTTHQCIGVMDDVIEEMAAAYNKKWRRNIKL